MHTPESKNQRLTRISARVLPAIPVASAIRAAVDCPRTFQPSDNPMRNGFAIALSLGLLASSSAIAHDTLPTKWCPTGTTVVTVGTFDLTPSTLVDYRTQRLSDGQVLGSECNDLKTCGIVDDWFWANEAAHEACTGLQKSTQSTPAMPLRVLPRRLQPQRRRRPRRHQGSPPALHIQVRPERRVRGVQAGDGDACAGAACGA